MNYSRNISTDYIRSVLSQQTEKPPVSEPQPASASTYSYFVNAPSSEMAEEIILKNESNALVRKLIHFCFSKKETIKQIPIIGKKLLEIKNSRLAAVKKCIDVSPYIPLHYSEFIPLMYQIFLNRVPDSSGLASFNAMVKNGASNAALAYVFAVSEEFGGRAAVANIKAYRKQYNKYVNRSRLKRIPVLGRIIRIFALPSQLSVFYDNYEYYNGKVIEANAALAWNIDVLSRRIFDINEALTGRVEALGREISGTNEALTGKVKVLSREISDTNEVLSRSVDDLKMKVNNINTVIDDRTLKIYNSISETDKNIMQNISENRSAFNSLTALTSEGKQYLESTITGMHEKIDGVSQITTAVSQKTDSMTALTAESRQCLEGMMTGIHEKMDVVSQVTTAVSQKTDDLPAYISQVSLKSKTAILGIPGGVISVMAGDYIFGVPSEEWGLAYYLSLNGHFEKGTEELFCKLLKPGMNVLDIGANLGMFTLHALKKECFVYSFEPSPKIYSILNQNIKVNGFAESGRIHTFEAAVSDKEKTISFFVCEGMSGHSNMYGSEKSDDKEIQVKTVVIDDLPELPDKVDIIKMDIEGAEYSALCGMKKVIARNPNVKIVMEFAPENIRRAGVEPAELLKLIRKYGFNYYLIDEVTSSLSRIGNQKLMECYSVNLLLTKDKVSL